MPAKNYRPLTTNLEHPKADKLERYVLQFRIQRTELLRIIVNYGIDNIKEVLGKSRPNAPPRRPQ